MRLCTIRLPGSGSKVDRFERHGLRNETGPKLKLRLLNVSKKELLKDLETSVDYDMSNLFKSLRR